ncbi:MAG TPA: hypothetical protein VKU00_03575 [Chthonomonadaceae bacterium]|nr:hypothetical protein [Chthonomonadaceae bacterium]
MQTPKRYRSWFIGLALGVVLALGIWPATSWLIRSQAALALPTHAALTPWRVAGLGDPGGLFTVIDIHAGHEDYRPVHETATRFPDDYRLQLAEALSNPTVNGGLSSADKIERLRRLISRFSDQPSLYANILRFCTQGQVRSSRLAEEVMFLHNPPPSSPSTSQTLNLKPVTTPNANSDTPEMLAAYDRDAAEGERLDPNNAYFPLMRAVGLFAAHRDTEALAAMQRASQKPEWNEYYADEVEGKWELHEQTFGHPGALIHSVYAAAILFPQYAQLKNTCRIAVANAISAEQKGHYEEGLAIRNTTRKCGEILRIRSRSIIGSIVGISMEKITLMRPCGAPLASGDQTNEQLLQDYDAYLQKIGHPDESAAAHAEVAAGVQVREIVSQSLDHGTFGMELPWLILYWIAGLLVLSSVFWMLALGGLAALLERHRRIREGQGLPPYARRGALCGLIAAALIGVSALGNALAERTTLGYNSSIAALNSSEGALLDQVALLSLVCWGGVLLLGGLSLTLPKLSWADRFRSGGVFLLSLAGVCLLGALCVWQEQHSVEIVVRMFGLFVSTEDGSQRMSLPVWPLGLIAGVPLLTLLTFSILSLVWRVPLSVGLVRGFRGMAVPIACALLLLYSGLVIVTLRQENQVEAGMRGSMQHEGRYMAELTGKTWPDTTP